MELLRTYSRHSDHCLPTLHKLERRLTRQSQRGRQGDVPSGGVHARPETRRRPSWQWRLLAKSGTPMGSTPGSTAACPVHCRPPNCQLASRSSGPAKSRRTTETGDRLAHGGLVPDTRWSPTLTCRSSWLGPPIRQVLLDEQSDGLRKLVGVRRWANHRPNYEPGRSQSLTFLLRRPSRYCTQVAERTRPAFFLGLRDLDWVYELGTH